MHVFLKKYMKDLTGSALLSATQHLQMLRTKKNIIFCSVADPDL
jgi:hypothetical protein